MDSQTINAIYRRIVSVAEIPELQCLHLQDVILGNFVSTCIIPHICHLSIATQLILMAVVVMVK